jgi:SAM-dependent methyltransferase
MTGGQWREHDEVRRDYDALARPYLEHVAGELAEKPFDQQLLKALIGRRTPSGLIADAGCGPGHVTGWLAAHGASVVGIDLSPGMIGEARRLNPHLRFDVKDMRALADEGPRFEAVIAFYSLIHFDDAALGEALASIRASLMDGGELLAAVHLGEGMVRPGRMWDVPVSLSFRMFAPGDLERAVERSGFAVTNAKIRDPYPDIEFPSRRLYLLATRSKHGRSSKDDCRTS